jgi:hypothetical protein
MSESNIYNILISQIYQVPTLLFWLVVGVLGFMQWNKLRKVAILLLSAFVLGVLDFIVSLAGQIWMYTNIENGSSASSMTAMMPVVYGIAHILFLASVICVLCAVFVDRKMPQPPAVQR